ncbi:MAG: hypothetical protein ACRBBS_07640 [Thalassovita sp.]
MRVFSVLALGLLAGCFPVDIYHKTGASLTRLQADETACKVKALKEVPVNKMTRVTPIRTRPREVCEKAGKCHIIYVTTGGRVQTYDANLRLRARYEAQCMADKGYAEVELPICTGKTPGTLPGTVPALTKDSCAVRTKTGYRAVTP